MHGLKIKVKNIHHHKLLSYFKMKETAEKYLGQAVTKAVITVPAYLMMLKDKQLKMGKIAV